MEVRYIEGTINKEMVEQVIGLPLDCTIYFNSQGGDMGSARIINNHLLEKHYGDVYVYGNCMSACWTVLEGVPFEMDDQTNCMIHEPNVDMYGKFTKNELMNTLEGLRLVRSEMLNTKVGKDVTIKDVLMEIEDGWFDFKNGDKVYFRGHEFTQIVEALDEVDES